MSVLEITEATIDQTLDEGGILIVDWWASWCGPCRAFAPVFEAAAGRHPDVRFGKIDTEANQNLSAQAGIRSIPTLMVFRDQVLVYSQPGALPAAALDDLIAQIKDLDMDEVRRSQAEASEPADAD